jgi:hypothetical protein
MSSRTQTIEVEVAIQRGKPGTRRRRGNNGNVPAPRLPRISRLMALAIKFQSMVDRDEVRDYADLARLGFVTRASSRSSTSACANPRCRTRVQDQDAAGMVTENPIGHAPARRQFRSIKSARPVRRFSPVQSGSDSPARF